MKRGKHKVRASVWYRSFSVSHCESFTLTPFTSESFQTLELIYWGKSNTTSLKKVLISTEAAANSVPTHEVVPSVLLL